MSETVEAEFDTGLICCWSSTGEVFMEDAEAAVASSSLSMSTTTTSFFSVLGTTDMEWKQKEGHSANENSNTALCPVF